ncbi:hypothetical protein T03_10548 [Trichinella britovi]|uniref:Uncharacterized protein n=1 Tax=Trichinella britovi TaxID=45882 RepID=A0A0V0Z1V9_TRIBR|nr:hypothetical protein T03_10548 [Trichinella britovi]
MMNRVVYLIDRSLVSRGLRLGGPKSDLMKNRFIQMNSE